MLAYSLPLGLYLHHIQMGIWLWDSIAELILGRFDLRFLIVFQSSTLCFLFLMVRLFEPK